jgi:hypothetical protein
MYKFFLYLMLIVIYLGLAKALSPSELGVHYLQNEKGFARVIKGDYTSVILIDTHTTGFFMKTYYQKYRVISGYDTVEELIVRTSKEFARRNLANIGLSVYRRVGQREEFLPIPPGSLYIGNREYGEWRPDKDEVLRWRFHKPFKNLPKYFGWGDFRPDMEFYQQLRSSISLNRPFYGQDNEFGPQGYVTQEHFPQFFRDERRKKVELRTLLVEYFKENF